jgi:hypothetical protein
VGPNKHDTLLNSMCERQSARSLCVLRSAGMTRTLLHARSCDPHLGLKILEGSACGAVWVPRSSIRLSRLASPRLTRSCALAQLFSLLRFTPILHASALFPNPILVVRATVPGGLQSPVSFGCSTHEACNLPSRPLQSEYQLGLPLL